MEPLLLKDKFFPFLEGPLVMDASQRASFS